MARRRGLMDDATFEGLVVCNFNDVEHLSKVYKGDLRQIIQVRVE
jgi:hypothetical protein